jgi:aryl-alcohol dehydrogenase-like predicted oxidoreductase
LVGARNAKQASENAASLDFDLFEEDIRFIDAEMGKVVIEEV